MPMHRRDFLKTVPLVLGTGKRLFSEAKMTRLSLIDITSIGTDGVTIQRFSAA